MARKLPHCNEVDHVVLLDEGNLDHESGVDHVSEVGQTVSSVCGVD